MQTCFTYVHDTDRSYKIMSYRCERLMKHELHKLYWSICRMITVYNFPPPLRIHKTNTPPLTLVILLPFTSPYQENRKCSTLLRSAGCCLLQGALWWTNYATWTLTAWLKGVSLIFTFMNADTDISLQLYQSQSRSKTPPMDRFFFYNNTTSNYC